MDTFAGSILRHKKAVLIFFVTAALLCVGLQFFVVKNYDMVTYLPPEAQSTKALKLMNREFSEALPNASVMIKNVSITEALTYKKKLADIKGVTQVLWLDDMVDIKKPLEMYEKDTVEAFYDSGSALFSVTITKGQEKATCQLIREAIGAEGALAGEAPDLAGIQEKTASEVFSAVLIIVPAIILLLLLSTSSWIEPLLFLANIGVAVLINMGTNLVFKQISFMTSSVSPILQLAVSLDYAIFLLHSFAAYRKTTDDVSQAMRKAVKASVVTVAASALTTLFGFVALAFMKFGIGADLGINLAKGIIISFVTTMVFLPALTLALYKLIDKTRHKQFMPEFKNVNRVLSKLAIPVVILVVLLVVPSFLGQQKTEFDYGSQGISQNTPLARHRAEIEQTFGKSTITVLLVPRGELVKEKQLSQDLRQIPHVTNVMSYVDTVGAEIPPDYLGKEITSRFYSDTLARLIVYTDTPEEGTLAFDTVGKIRSTAEQYYGDGAATLGQAANLLDMRDTIKEDNKVVNIIAIISIFLVLLVSLRSLSLPIILLFTIEVGIWINLSIPYFLGTNINFIGYLVLSTVQLGATVDYAILLTNHYLKHRRALPRRQAIHQAMGDSFKSILVSAATLSLAGFTLFFTSTNPASGDIGLLLGRGTILSMFMVVCFLPATLVLFDKAIAKTTLGTHFSRGNNDNQGEKNNEN